MKIYSVENKPENLAATLAQELSAALKEHRRVAWLLPGGSGIAINVAAMNLLNADETSNLVLMQTDERFVPTNHPDNNWRQMTEAGFDQKQAEAYPIVTNDTASLEETTQAYNEVVRREFTQADYIIGQFGVGADGHIAGVKPHSPAVFSDQMVAGYEGDDFKRISLTPAAFQKIDMTRTFAFGESKKPVIEALGKLSASKNLEEFPASILVDLPNSTFYTDQSG